MTTTHDDELANPLVMLLDNADATKTVPNKILLGNHTYTREDRVQDRELAARIEEAEYYLAISSHPDSIFPNWIPKVVFRKRIKHLKSHQQKGKGDSYTGLVFKGDDGLIYTRTDHPDGSYTWSKTTPTQKEKGEL